MFRVDLDHGWFSALYFKLVYVVEHVHVGLVCGVFEGCRMRILQLQTESKSKKNHLFLSFASLCY